MVFIRFYKWVFSWWRYMLHCELTVSCWFCGLDAVINIEDKDRWICGACEQQNGFDESGDYIHPIEAQFAFKEDTGGGSRGSYGVRQQVLCHSCANHQTIKVRQLAAYTPLHEENFNEEIERYSQYLEMVYRLCDKCDNKVSSHLTAQDQVLLDKMEVSGVDTLLMTKEEAEFKQHLSGSNVEGSTDIGRPRNLVPSLLFFICVILALILGILNIRILTAASSHRIFSNSILQGCIDYIVEVVSSKLAIDTAEILEYVGMILCFIGMYSAGSNCWYPEDAVHVNLWVSCVVIANKEVVSLLPVLAVRGLPHLFLAVCCVVSAAVSTLRPRVPRHLVNVNRRDMNTQQKRSPVMLKRKSDTASESTLYPALDEHRRMKHSSLDNVLPDLNAFSLGSRKPSKGSSSQFWPVYTLHGSTTPPASPERSASSSLSDSQLSSPEDIAGAHGDQHRGHRPILSPSKLGFVNFDVSSSSSASSHRSMSPPVCTSEHQLQLSTSNSSCDESKSTFQHQPLSLLNRFNFNNSEVSELRLAPSRPKGNILDNVRRSNRIATKVRPWPLRKAYSCDVDIDMVRPSLVKSKTLHIEKQNKETIHTDEYPTIKQKADSSTLNDD